MGGDRAAGEAGTRVRATARAVHVSVAHSVSVSVVFNTAEQVGPYTPSVEWGVLSRSPVLLASFLF